ncbi:MAG: zinc-dependent peptidase [Acidobacteria bacterium]|nr:zinc-dependent peptidase [Acidobacteriota bacterium]MBU4308159.1 zinc-dependent peptidase [Acidobacteriota bacterium]MBU4404640.1 zinc-dependent peptidase [Acidobacteriota bacterium]MCG2812848.1 zinc-dependent peptidase [Candidatus Aminicenantes bacterium]
MRVIARYDLFFIVLYALLIPVVGVLVFCMTGRTVILPLLLLLEALYLMLALRKPWQRRQGLRMSFPGEGREFLLSRSAYFHGLDEAGRMRFERDVRLFLVDVLISGIGGRPLSWQTRLLIAAGAAAMLHGRPDWEPPLVDGVTIYPGMSFDRNYQVKKGNIAGQAPAGGPMLLAEGSLMQGFADTEDGFNVLIHELAHFFDREARKSGLKLRLRSGTVNWAETIAREWERHNHGTSILPAYAAQNEAEFFAVASEMFFENPRPLHDAHPELFEILREFYQQDPRQVLVKNLRGN